MKAAKNLTQPFAVPEEIANGAKYNLNDKA